jgi:hypothetical protein
MLCNINNASTLQIIRLIKACFCRKIRGVSQKNGGPTKIILHFFSSFFGFGGFLPLQAIDFQAQAAVQPLQKKSCLKHYRRFFVCPGICQNRRMNVEMTGRNGGFEGWTAIRCAPALRTKRFGARNERSAFDHPAGKRRGRMRTPKPAALSRAHQT